MPERGLFGVGITLLVATASFAAILSFAPIPVENRKDTVFNAWAFGLAAQPPPIISPPPHPNGAAGVIAVALAL